MENMHTPEPWEVNGLWPSMIYGGKNLVAKTHADICYTKEDTANARRITAAVNACAGIPTDMLEEGLVKKAMADFEMMRVENGRLKIRMIAMEHEKEKFLKDFDNSETIGEVIAKMDAEDRCKSLIQALKEISEGAGPFSKDPLKHAENVIENLKSVASAALAEYQSGYTPTEQNCKGCFGVCGKCEELEEELEALRRNTNYKLAEQEYKLFIGTETGIEDIEEVPKGKDIFQYMDEQKEIVKQDLSRVLREELQKGKIEEGPDEPDYDNQAKDYDEDRRWEGSPTEYDM